MGEIVEIIKAIGQGGPLAVSVVLGYLLYRLERMVNTGQTKTENAITRVHERIDDIEKRFIGREEFEEHVRQMKIIQSEYHPKEDFYREMGGWRTEINNISIKLDNFIMGILQK